LLIDKLRSIDCNNKKIDNHMFEDSSFSFEVFDCALVYISTLWEIRSNANRWFAIVRCLRCRNSVFLCLQPPLAVARYLRPNPIQIPSPSRVDFSYLVFGFPLQDLALPSIRYSTHHRLAMALKIAIAVKTFWTNIFGTRLHRIFCSDAGVP